MSANRGRAHFSCLRVGRPGIETPSNSPIREAICTKIHDLSVEASYLTGRSEIKHQWKEGTMVNRPGFAPNSAHMQDVWLEANMVEND